jgi:hypothetical protein
MKLISNFLTLFIIAALAVMALHGTPEQQASSDLSESDLFCMVQNVYHEARGEDALGQAAVAHVTLNRVRSPAYPDTVCGVVWQQGQFSWTEDGKSDRMTDLGAIGKAVDTALARVAGQNQGPYGREPTLLCAPQGAAKLGEEWLSVHSGRSHVCEADER